MLFRSLIVSDLVHVGVCKSASELNQAVMASLKEPKTASVVRDDSSDKQGVGV